MVRDTHDAHRGPVSLGGRLVKQPRGRPREFDGTVSVRLPNWLHDALIREALRQDRDLSDVIRHRLSSYFVSQNPQSHTTAA